MYAAVVITLMHTVKIITNLEQLTEAYKLDQATMGFKIEDFYDRGTTMAKIWDKIEAFEDHSTIIMQTLRTTIKVK